MRASTRLGRPNVGASIALGLSTVAAGDSSVANSQSAAHRRGATSSYLPNADGYRRARPRAFRCIHMRSASAMSSQTTSTITSTVDVEPCAAACTATGGYTTQGDVCGPVRPTGWASRIAVRRVRLTRTRACGAESARGNVGKRDVRPVRPLGTPARGLLVVARKMQRESGLRSDSGSPPPRAVRTPFMRRRGGCAERRSPPVLCQGTC